MKLQQTVSEDSSHGEDGLKDGKRMTPCTDYLVNRRSVRAFTEKSVSKNTIRNLVQIATMAPSAHNAQPTRYVLLADERKRQNLVAAMSKLFRKDLLKDGVSPTEIGKIIDESEQAFLYSPVLLLVCLTMRDMDTYPDKTRMDAEYTMAVQSTAASIQNLLLAAHIEGLGTCWRCAPLFCKEIIKEKLGLPADYDPQAFILIGYPDEVPDAPKRKPIFEILEFI